MISLHRSKEILTEESLSKKRKLDDEDGDDDIRRDIVSEKPNKTKSMEPAGSVQTHQFPLDWQRCLDIKSGQIYFYNTRTNKRTSGDPKSSHLETYHHRPHHNNPAPMSLELELNLPSQSQLQVAHKHNNDNFKGIMKSPSWLTLEADEQEMVTAVCSKCYMLVMMSKSCPACPNCKFLHPSGLSSNVFGRQVEG